METGLRPAQRERAKARKRRVMARCRVRAKGYPYAQAFGLPGGPAWRLQR